MKKNKPNRRQIILASTSHGVTDLYSSFIIGLIPILVVKFGLSFFLVALLTSINGISNSLTQPFFGYFSDKYGLKYFLVAGPLFASIFLSMLGIAPNYLFILIILFLGNLSVSAFHPPSAAIAGHFGGKRKGFGVSIISLGGIIGYSFGSIFIILVVEKFGLKFTPITMIPGIIMSIILLKYVPSTLATVNSTRKIHFISKLRNVKKSKFILFSFIFFTSYSRDLVWLLLLTFMPLYFTYASISLTNVGYILLIFGLAGGIGGLFAGYYSDKIKNKTYIMQAALIISIPLIYFIFKTSGFLSIILFIASGFFLISTLPICTRIAQSIFPGSIGFASSIVMGLSVGTASITMIFLGKLADSIGIISTISYALILPIISIFLLIFYPLLKKKFYNNSKP